MHVFLFLCFIGLTFAAPQGYNYQSQGGSGGSNTADNNEYTQEQYQILQTFYQQQQQQELAEQEQLQQQLQAQYQQQLQQQHQQFTTVENNVTPSQLVQEPQQQQQQQQQQQPQQQQPLETAAVAKEQGYQTAIPAIQTQNLVFQSQPAIAEVKVQQAIKQQASVPVSYAANTHVEQQPHPVQHSKPTAFVQSKTPNYQTVKYNKEFYFLAAPKEDDSDDVPQELRDQLNQTKRNIRVVFIEAPEQNSLTNAALQLAKQSIESQTAIYVLTKQHDVAGLATKLQEIRGSSSAKAKPEVIFIKYKTPEEAEHAQRTIQAQYEALDGPNSFNYQGVAPSHSFVDSTGVDPRKSIGKILAESAHATAPAELERPNSQYLPAANAAKKQK